MVTELQHCRSDWNSCYNQIKYIIQTQSINFLHQLTAHNCNDSRAVKVLEGLGARLLLFKASTETNTAPESVTNRSLAC